MSNRANAAARALVPHIVEWRDATESDRRVAEPIVEQLRASGLGGMAVVSELGGMEASTLDAVEVYETLAAAEGSVAWVAWNNSLPCLFSRYLPREGREEIFADPGWLYANSTRPSGKAVVEAGGYRVRGRWSLVSGCELAEWLALMCVVVDDGRIRMAGERPDVRLMFVPRGACTILDTWHAGGLRGTGSHDVMVEDVFVPEEHSASPMNPPTLDAPIGRVPIISTLASGFASQALGLAGKALETVVELAKTKVSPDPRPDLRDQPINQAEAAAHSAAVAAARSHLHQMIDQVWDKAVNGTEIGLPDIASVWSAAHHANAVSREAVNAMYAIGGTSSLYTDCPLERVHRDMHAMMRHVISQSVWRENAGRVMFGLEPEEPLFFI